MHVQQRPEDRPPPLGSLLPGSGSAWQRGEHACSPFPQVLRCQLSSEGAENNDAAGSKCAVPSTLPGAWSKSQQGKRWGGSRECTRLKG